MCRFAKKEAIEVAKEIRTEWVLSIKGKVNERPEKNKNDKVQNGDIEIEILNIEILNKAEVLPFEISSDTKDINEDTRLKYRYLDLRSERMQKNIRARGKLIKYVRDFMDSEGFVEVETPILTKSTPEGSARLCRAFQTLPRQILCSTTITSTIQTTFNDCRYGKIFPNCEMYAR